MEPVTKNLPVIAMRGLNVFPRMNTSFDLERPISVHALERAMENREEIFLVTQREIGVEQPEEKDLYEIGTVARVTQILRVSDRVLRVMMEGACRARLKRLWQREPFLQAQVELIDEPATSCHSKRTEAMLRQTYASVTEYAELAQKLPDDVYAAILSTNDPGYLADFIAQQLNLRYQDKQDILDELRPLPRLQRMNEILRREIEVPWSRTLKARSAPASEKFRRILSCASRSRSYRTRSVRAGRTKNSTSTARRSARRT